MASRWTDLEEKDLFDFLTESKEASWEEVHNFMVGKGYNRTSEACRKRYGLLVKEKEVEVASGNDYTADIVNNLVASLPTMSEEDWQFTNTAEGVESSENLDEINLDEIDPTQEYVELDKFTQEKKNDVVSIVWAIVFIIFCSIVYSFVH